MSKLIIKSIGRCTGVNERSMWEQSRGLSGRISAAQFKSIKSSLEFKLDEDVAITIEIHGIFEIGKQFELLITELDEDHQTNKSRNP